MGGLHDGDDNSGGSAAEQLQLSVIWDKPGKGMDAGGNFQDDGSRAGAVGSSQGDKDAQ